MKGLDSRSKERGNDGMAEGYRHLLVHRLFRII